MHEARLHEFGQYYGDQNEAAGAAADLGIAGLGSNNVVTEGGHHDHIATADARGTRAPRFL